MKKNLPQKIPNSCMKKYSNPKMLQRNSLQISNNYHYIRTNLVFSNPLSNTVFRRKTSPQACAILNLIRLLQELYHTKEPKRPPNYNSIRMKSTYFKQLDLEKDNLGGYT